MKLDGTRLASEILREAQREIKKTRRKIRPQLSVVLVGSNPASLSYVRQKQLAAKRIGALLTFHQFEKAPPYQKIAEFLLSLSHDPKVHGIILQRPLPPSLSASDLTKRISTLKDVDGFLPKTLYTAPIGLAIFKILNEIYFRHILKRAKPKDDFSKGLLSFLKQKQIVLIGRGETGGRPIADTLTQHRLSFIILNSQSENAAEYLQNADIVISAVGKTGVIKANFLKPDCILLGVGLHPEKRKMVGDYDERDIEKTVAFYTPTPGGVGPVNVACLMQNLVQAYKLQIRSK